MTVYIVMFRLPYEGEALERCFSSEEKAMAWIAEQRNPGHYYIEDRELIE